MSSKDLITLVVGVLAPSLFFSWTTCFLVRLIAERWGLVDRPTAPHKRHGRPTPLGGGLAIWFAVVLFFALGQCALWLIPDSTQTESRVLGFALPQLFTTHLDGLRARSCDVWAILGAGSVIMVLGLYDDRFRLSWQVRLVVQFTVAILGVVIFQNWRLTAFLDYPWVTGLLSVVWIVGLVNSFNMLDNMDGLSAGVAGIAATMLAITLILVPEPGSDSPQLFVVGFLLVLIGSLIGFLWHNRPPARLFMGDAGSYFVGFCIAMATSLATFADYRGQSSHVILAPLCVMAVPLYDITTVISIRLWEGRSPFVADHSHFSHRLVELGFSRGWAVLAIYLMTGICGLAALLLHQVNFLGAFLVILLVACVLALIGVLETVARRKVLSSGHAATKTRQNDSCK